MAACISATIKKLGTGRQIATVNPAPLSACRQQSRSKLILNYNIFRRLIAIPYLSRYPKFKRRTSLRLLRLRLRLDRGSGRCWCGRRRWRCRKRLRLYLLSLWRVFRFGGGLLLFLAATGESQIKHCYDYSLY